jgi:chromate transporter
MRQPTAREIGSVFVRYGSLTFGGGTPTATALERELVEHRSILERSQFRLAYALSRVSPGTNLLALCAALGWQLRGWKGALAALLAASIPCSLMVALLTYLYERWSTNSMVLTALQGVTAAAVGIIAATCWQLIRPHVRSAAWRRTAVIVAGSLTLSSLHVPPIRVLLIAAAVGFFWREQR